MKSIPTRGDIVKCNYSFLEERELYKLPYPKKGDYLTVKDCLKDPEHGYYVLFFEDLQLSIGLSSARFDLVQTEQEADSVLNNVYKIANNL